MSEPLDDLDAQVRRTDPDRWLASRFIADPAARADVVALYAYNGELARAASGVREPLMGEIRLTWWREAMEEAAAGKPPRRHPVAEGVAAGFDPADLAKLPEGRLPDLDRVPLGAEALAAYLDATAGAVMALAARRLDRAARPEAVRGAARAFGLAGLWRAKGAGLVTPLPADWTAEDVAARVRAELVAAKGELAHLPVAAFPAVAYAALARPYARGRAPGDLAKRLRILWAVLRGRL